MPEFVEENNSAGSVERLGRNIRECALEELEGILVKLAGKRNAARAQDRSGLRRLQNRIAGRRRTARGEDALAGRVHQRKENKLKFSLFVSLLQECVDVYSARAWQREVGIGKSSRLHLDASDLIRSPLLLGHWRRFGQRADRGPRRRGVKAAEQLQLTRKRACDRRRFGFERD
jgi:hypothetical protein